MTILIMTSLLNCFQQSIFGLTSNIIVNSITYRFPRNKNVVNVNLSVHIIYVIQFHFKHRLQNYWTIHLI